MTNETKVLLGRVAICMGHLSVLGKSAAKTVADIGEIAHTDASPLGVKVTQRCLEFIRDNVNALLAGRSMHAQTATDFKAFLSSLEDEKEGEPTELESVLAKATTALALIYKANERCTTLDQLQEEIREALDTSGVIVRPLHPEAGLSEEEKQ